MEQIHNEHRHIVQHKQIHFIFRNIVNEVNPVTHTDSSQLQLFYPNSNTMLSSSVYYL